MAYEGTPFSAAPIYNEITAASAVSVLSPLLPGASRLQFSAPAPMGLPAGYPVTIRDRKVFLDLPSGLSRVQAIAFNQRQGERDGIDRIAADGTVHFTDQVNSAITDLDPELAEPLKPGNLAVRTKRFLPAVDSMYRE